MIDTIKTYCDEVVAEFDFIPEERKVLLSKVTDYIHRKQREHEPVQLVYICTHNSRRSHFGQIWAHVAADYFGIKNVRSFSGGTEATAFNTNAINALKRVGFAVRKMTEEVNSRYYVYHSETTEPSVCFSKVYDDPENPQTSFAAIMTCSDAEDNCPFIPGVELRIGTTYDDPKAFDNTLQCDEKYDERCRQIARETLFVFSKAR